MDDCQVFRHCRWTGLVQGIGFRPLAVRLARALKLRGWIRNTPSGVEAAVAGSRSDIGRWVEGISAGLPLCGSVMEFAMAEAGEAVLPEIFEVAPSLADLARGFSCLVPDLAMCPECRAEIRDPSSRRYRYPFTSCSHCGPRYSILEGLPFDRERTSMRDFPLCPDCLAEYENPEDRRFHAQASACPRCGPALWRMDSGGALLDRGHESLLAAAENIRCGKIVAVQGIGGFHLMVRADDEAAVQRLRERKRRPAKPFAVMVADVGGARALARVSADEERWLLASAAPIVLLDPSPAMPLAPSVTPSVPSVGVMVAATPLHLLLLEEAGCPVVATSGNLSDEPLCTAPDEAVQRLGGIADYFLANNRRIVRPLDDSVIRGMAGEPVVLRRAKGYAPAPLSGRFPSARRLLAAGGHLKSTFAMAGDGHLICSQHLGDLGGQLSRDGYAEALRDHREIFGAASSPFDGVAVDAHPDYASSRLVSDLGEKFFYIQHHHAHAAAVAWEHGLEECFGVVWDGVGMGLDGVLWGGEFLNLRADGTFVREGFFKKFRLPGGEMAIREPARSAAGVCVAMGAGGLLKDGRIAGRMGLAASRADSLVALAGSAGLSPWTTSAGRLFDAASAILGLAPSRGYEGQAAMALEAAARGMDGEVIPCPILREDGGWCLDWSPLMRYLFEATAGEGAASFHRTMAAAAAEMCLRGGARRVVLSGGCFQNRILLEAVRALLVKEGVDVFLPRDVPPNDGGLSVGQIQVLRQILEK